MDTKVTDLKSERMLSAALQILAPLVDNLVREGVQHGVLSRELKTLFADSAARLLEERGAKVTDSAVSLLSGVHRKDLRQMAQGSEDVNGHGSIDVRVRAVSPLSEVFTRWATDPAYCDAQGEPRVLQRFGEAPSFDALAQSVTRDVHPGSLLDSLVHMGLVRETADGLQLSPGGFVPQGNVRELMQLFADNLHDHLASATVNLTAEKPRFLEHSVFADELTEASVAMLHGDAVALWNTVFRQFAAKAAQQCEADANRPTEALMRLRFGAYFYAAPMTGAANPGEQQ